MPSFQDVADKMEAHVAIVRTISGNTIVGPYEGDPATGMMILKDGDSAHDHVWVPAHAIESVLLVDEEDARPCSCECLACEAQARERMSEGMMKNALLVQEAAFGRRRPDGPDRSTSPTTL